MAARLPELFFYVFFCFRAAVPSAAKRKAVSHGECGKLEGIMLLKKPLVQVICYLAVRIRQMTQYAATAVADIDPDSARLLLDYCL